MARVKVKLLFFAKSREIVGKKEVDIEFESCTTGRALLKNLVEEYPQLSVIAENVVLSLNEEYLNQDNQELRLQIEADVAVEAAVAADAGKDEVDVVEQRLSVESITDAATSPKCGAIALFVGTTRDNFEGRKVLRLEYEAYMPMARKKMLETCSLMRSKWSLENIVMLHRIGKEALEAVHFAIDHVKATVPVWKKEIYADESSSWKQNRECQWSSSHPPGS